MNKILCRLPKNMQAIELAPDDYSHEFYQEFCRLRDYHYIERNHWESAGNDTYDQHSVVLVLVDGDKVIVGCRIIKDSKEASLPIRSVLNSHNKPIGQVPKGSVELSRFVIHPELLGKKAACLYLHHFIHAVNTYTSTNGFRYIFAVLISILERSFRRSSCVKVERLPDGVISHHGQSTFYTVRLSV